METAEAIVLHTARRTSQAPAQALEHDDHILAPQRLLGPRSLDTDDPNDTEEELTMAIRRQFPGQNDLLTKFDSSGNWTKLGQKSTKQLRFPNAIPVLGIKHICDNLMDSCLSSMESHLGLLQSILFLSKVEFVLF